MVIAPLARRHRQIAGAAVGLGRHDGVASVDVDTGLADAQRACLEVDVRPAQPADLLAAQAQQLRRCGVPRRGQTPISLICISLDARHEARTDRSKGHHWP
jgi:hypothetical protein